MVKYKQMQNNVALFDLSTMDLVIILVIVLLLFGSSKLPELSRNLGRSMKEMRKGMSEAGELKKDVKRHADATFNSAPHGNPGNEREVR